MNALKLRESLINKFGTKFQFEIGDGDLVILTIIVENLNQENKNKIHPLLN